MYDSTGDARHRFERWSADARVREAQRVLQERGYYRGSLDGLMTPETRRAVWAFQKAQGFRLSGRLEAQTMAALGLGSTGTVSKDDPSNFGPQPSALPGPSSGTRRSAPAPGNLQAP
jgi:peptidoglycan hydrolase-like protein with peptidoglycan-binding domain